VRGTTDAVRRRWRVVGVPSGRMGAVGAENRSYEMQIAQKYPEGDGVGPNARRLAYGKSATALTVQHVRTGAIYPGI
jgi:hypothetical protein